MTETTREGLRAEIERIYQTSWMRRYWRAIGRGLAHLVRRKGEAPVWVSTLVVFIVVQLITALAILAFKEQRTSMLVSIQFSYPMLAYCWLGLMIIQTMVERYIKHLKADIVDALDLPNGQIAFESWLRSVEGRSFRSPFVLLFVGWITFMIILVVFGQQNQSAASAYLFTALVFIQLVPHLYWVTVMAITFAFSIRQWKFELFLDDPASTPIIQSMHRLSSNFLLAIAFLLALNQLLAIPVGLYSPLYVIGMLAALWTPTLLFFFVRESSFAHLLFNARLKRLAYLQKQITEIEQSQDLRQKEPAETVRRLLELHEQVKSAPVSMINLNSIANLLGSLALPLLATLVSLYDLWKNVFQTP